MQRENKCERNERWEVIVTIAVCFALGFLIHLMHQVQKKEDVFREVMREDRVTHFATALSQRQDLVRLLSDKRERFTLIVPADVVVRLSSASFDGKMAGHPNMFAELEDYIFKGQISPFTLSAGNASELQSLSGNYVTVTRKENFDRHLLEVNNQPIRKIIHADNGVILVVHSRM